MASISKESKPNNAKLQDRLAGFAAGIASGATKLVVGHPFDTIKVRMQVEGGLGRFSGPMDCLISTIKREKFRGLYKGALPPLIGWSIMDAVQLGSLSNARLILQGGDKSKKLRPVDNALAGVAAGWTVALVATPVELMKIRLQTQYNAYGSNEPRKYSSAYDCARKTIQKNGITGLWYGLHATIFQRSFFFFLWGSYDIYSNYFRSLQKTSSFPYLQKSNLARDDPNKRTLSDKTVSFLAGGLSANTFWTLVYPVDVAKNRYMSDTGEKYPTFRSAFKYIYKTEGFRGFFRGFVPSFIRSFPTNGCAVFVWDTTMRFMVGHGHN
ncbi:hypothetical protein BB559_001150 [Furculomyces boomerangus]|uniref:Mitochondrial thiamine pyrophosphate carrier 1 n=2 Tax=Harpellales TaxID=61421 RepID=A0A2T9Z2W3_9FUNG|nr:hypothetical protein BB559_001150 [Furculomyces boomerangus]PVZ98394.1 hypothetical protein BB558_005611 [Smittium angustum]